MLRACTDGSVFSKLAPQTRQTVIKRSRLRGHCASFLASSETQGQLVGTTGFSWAKVYNKSGRAPGHLLLPIQFQKRLNSLLLIFFWPISEEEQPGDSHVFLHEVVFLINRRSSVARSTGTFLRRASEKINK